jgi:hypothetical protein
MRAAVVPFKPSPVLGEGRVRVAGEFEHPHLGPLHFDNLSVVSQSNHRKTTKL